MTGSAEYADGSSYGAFPEEWGRPVGEPLSQARADWVRAQVRRHMASAPLCELAERQVKFLNALRLAELQRRRTCV